ncbi:PLP-dependent aminotransferase family protein [Vibrio sinensis]|uniref:PLP-dependent aminotransferase family protein n=1 Tax=Vibrio sinensis TaxID=2302434 RepID=A0A3A6QSM1_9VIBR|nr:PLP-dependent aminotransferase family protein [Vibrio sinensis]RJX75775.1 PLP-dependent aminotransferase family protein [Vibrio sinensis]
MSLIDASDLTLSDSGKNKQQALFDAIRQKIVAQLWPKGARLPATRRLATELGISRNTVIFAYEQLCAEGYINSQKGSGFFVAVELPETFLPAKNTPPSPTPNDETLSFNQPFSPGVPDLAQFPIQKWQRLVARHHSRRLLLGNQSIQGLEELRVALCEYLSTSRSVQCSPQQIIITSGAQQALTITTLAIGATQRHFAMEQPGYTQMVKVLSLFGHSFETIAVHPRHGLDIDMLSQSSASALYITPSNQYPMGTHLDLPQRLQLIEWAKARNGWIIEDDYDSEFQFSHRPYPSLQGLAAQVSANDRVIYIGSLSKVMFNGLRLGYMIVPEHLVEPCIEIKDALTGDSPTHTQAALADFIASGELIRHVRKMRRVYKEKYLAMERAITKHFADQVEIISQPAGLHITFRWTQGPREQDFVESALAQGITIRPLSYYESAAPEKRTWQAVILGFGNVALEQIEPIIKTLARLFSH